MADGGWRVAGGGWPVEGLPVAGDDCTMFFYQLIKPDTAKFS